MSDKKISQLPAASDTDVGSSASYEIPVVVNGTTKKVSNYQVLAPVRQELQSTDSKVTQLSSQLSDKASSQSVTTLNAKVEIVEEKVEVVDDMTFSVQDLQGNVNGKHTLYISDANGKVVAKISSEGVKSVDFITAGGKKLSDQQSLQYPISTILHDFYDDKFLVTDKDGNICFRIDENGVAALSFESSNIMKNQWGGKVMATYGDSVTAINDGDWQYPYTFNSEGKSRMWANYAAQYLHISKQYGRGIGSQGYKWTTAGGNGGSICWLTPTGACINRNDSFNYDNFNGTSYPTGVSQAMVDAGTAIPVRGALSSWRRITKSFPASIKDTIDVVLVMAHNDAYDSTDCAFVENDSTDTEWAASGSDYYGKINGDYDLTTLKGGIASTLMKLQLWMPNAVIVLMTGISGQGTTGQLNKDINGVLTRTAESIRQMSKLTSIPCIDTFASDGINGWNRTSFISDSIHPYTSAGGKMFARAIVGGLMTILPNNMFNF